MWSAERVEEEGDGRAARLSDAVDFSGAVSIAGDRLRAIPKNKKQEIKTIIVF